MPGLTAKTWSAATTLATPALRLMLRRRARIGKEITARLPEREGVDPTPRPPGPLVWIHAASVGESLSILPVVDALAPHATILVTSGTTTSAALLAERLPPQALHRFVPLDVPAWAARFLAHWRPDAAAFVESELWPNLLAACHNAHIPLMLVNARMSERSHQAWQRAPAFARDILQTFTRIHPQSEVDATRLTALGATITDPPANLKFATPPLPADPIELAHLRETIAGRPAWLAASTHDGEDTIAINIHRRLAPTHPGLITIIVPRHPAKTPTRPQDENIWLVDRMGVLGLYYRLVPIVFVGRSLVGQGGQNPLEPARLGCAVAMGPHTANFEHPVHRLREAGALTTVTHETALADWIAAMLAAPDKVAAIGAAARAVANAEATLPPRIAAAILSMVPHP